MATKLVFSTYAEAREANGGPENIFVGVNWEAGIVMEYVIGECPDHYKAATLDERVFLKQQDEETPCPTCGAKKVHKRRYDGAELAEMVYPCQCWRESEGTVSSFGYDAR